MPNNSLWNLIIKIASFLAILFLLLGAALTYASHFGLAQNNVTVVLTVFVGVILSIFALIGVNFANYKIEHEIKDAIEIANQIAHGELFQEDVKSESDLLAALQNISDNLRTISAEADQISEGDLSININSHSDTDVFGKSLGNMVEKLRSLIQTQEERDYLQKSILKLLREVSEVAAGDLTVQAEVSSEMTGAIAEAFNSMTKELRSLIKQVKDVTFQVSSSANQINDTTEQLARGSAAQASQISLTTQAIAQMALQIQEVSGNASLSAQVAATRSATRVTARKPCRTISAR